LQISTILNWQSENFASGVEFHHRRKFMSLKNIIAKVGQATVNIPSDVATVQYLLNCVPASHGGPIKELVIDGFVGVLTIEAINRFQQAHFGTSNGGVEPDGQTLKELKKYDPLPYSSPIVAFNSQKLDPSKMNRGAGTVSSIYIKKSFDIGGVKEIIGIKKSIDGGGIKRQLYAGTNDDSI
jgi:hypothetical protein